MTTNQRGRPRAAESVVSLSELHPNELVRKSQGPRFFGLKATQLDDAIEQGLIPRPFPVYEGSRATAWTGQMIIDHHRARMNAAKAG